MVVTEVLLLRQEKWVVVVAVVDILPLWEQQESPGRATRAVMVTATRAGVAEAQAV